MKLKPIYFYLVLHLLPVTALGNEIDTVLGNASTSVRADDIPAGDAGYNYIPGAAMAKDNIQAPTYSRTVSVGASIYASRHRSCGELNPFDNFESRIGEQIQQKMDEVLTIAKMIPQLILDSAVEYAMARINPILNQLFVKKIDEYIELFRLNVKACEDVQSELSNNPNSNVFDDLFQIAIADEWQAAIADGTFDNSRQFKEKIAKRAQKKGIVMADGNRYGGESTAPINLVHSLSKAGINLLAGRNAPANWDNNFNPVNRKKMPITQAFEKPEDLIEFIEDLYGSTEFKIAEAGTSKAVKSKAGIGYFLRYTENRVKTYQALEKYVARTMTRTNFEKKTGVLIPPAIVDDVRLAEPYSRQVELERLSKQYAIDDLKKKLMFAKAALSAGVTAPNMVQSPAAGLSEREYKKLYFRIQDDLAELDMMKY